MRDRPFDRYGLSVRRWGFWGLGVTFTVCRFKVKVWAGSLIESPFFNHCEVVRAVLHGPLEPIERRTSRTTLQEMFAE